MAINIFPPTITMNPKTKAIEMIVAVHNILWSKRFLKKAANPFSFALGVMIK